MGASRLVNGRRMRCVARQMPRLLSWHGDEGGAEVDGLERLVCKLMKLIIREFSNAESELRGGWTHRANACQFKRGLWIERKPRIVGRGGGVHSSEGIRIKSRDVARQFSVSDFSNKKCAAAGIATDMAGG